LGAFWARRLGPVKSNLTLVLMIVEVQEGTHVIPRRKNVPPTRASPGGDMFGMIAVVLLDHSLNAGTNAAILQFNTICKNHSDMSNYERTTEPEMRHAALAGYKKR
jgi:hypothetical protein